MTFLSGGRLTPLQDDRHFPDPSPLGAARHCPLKRGSYAWTKTPWNWTTPLPADIPTGTLVRIHKIIDTTAHGEKQRLQVEDQRGQLHTLCRYQLFPGWQFRIAGTPGWHWDTSAPVLQILHEEIDGRYPGRAVLDRIPANHAIIARAAAFTWRGMTIAR